MGDAPAKSSFVSGWFKAIGGGAVALIGGAATMYSTALFDKVVKPAKPMANFSTKVDGLSLICESRATGESGWWDFGDGTALEPFEANKGASHTYTKPGNYNVKLTVRNFISEENDRTVPVEIGKTGVAATPGTNTAPTPVLSVEATTANPVAPATFKVKAEVKNAEKVFINVASPNALPGEPNKIELKPAGGVIETLVLVEKPGQHVIQVFGTKGNEVVQQSAFVTVAAPADGSVVCYLIVTDTGTRVNTRKMPTTIPITIPAKGDAKTFERNVTGLAGYLIGEAKITAPAFKAAANVKVTVSPDKQSLKLTGDWNGKPDALLKLAGGSDLMIPLEVTYVQQETISVPTKLSAKLNAGRDTVALPPALIGLSNAQRTIDFELCQYRASGERTVMANGKLVNGKLNQKINWAGQSYTLDIAATDRQATVMLGR